MNTINERIKYLRKELKKSQKEFGQYIGLKPNSISDIETGKNAATEQTLKAICREFNINETWLRTGVGEMQSDIDIDFGTICSKIGINDPRAKQAIIDYWHLSDEDKELFLKFVDKFMH